MTNNKPMTYDWYSKEEDNKEIRRKAANEFLSAVLDGSIQGITGLDEKTKQKAHDEFNKKVRAEVLAATGKEQDMPDKVEVVCLEADTDSRSDLVVFILHRKDAQIPTPTARGTGGLWLERWVAAWAPY
jgi:hypothetical protein